MLVYAKSVCIHGSIHDVSDWLSCRRTHFVYVCMLFCIFRMYFLQNFTHDLKEIRPPKNVY